LRIVNDVFDKTLVAHTEGSRRKGRAHHSLIGFQNTWSQQILKPSLNAQSIGEHEKAFIPIETTKKSEKKP
jgi:hypothetical protein